MNMRHRINRLIAARIVFFAGLILMLLGSAFLLGNLTGISRLSILGAFFFVIIGLLCAMFAIKLNKRSLYLFFAAFFMLLGFFLFLSALHVIPVSLRQGWPFISVFAGLALVPSGWHCYGRFRVRYIVPGAVFVILGCLLLVFSLDIVPFSFTHFMLDWWPLLLALGGLILALIALGTKSKGEA